MLHTSFFEEHLVAGCSTCKRAWIIQAFGINQEQLLKNANHQIDQLHQSQGPHSCSCFCEGKPFFIAHEDVESIVTSDWTLYSFEFQNHDTESNDDFDEDEDDFDEDDEDNFIIKDEKGNVIVSLFLQFDKEDSEEDGDEEEDDSYPPKP